jgi:hypothetical protein
MISLLDYVLKVEVIRLHVSMESLFREFYQLFVSLVGQFGSRKG